MSEEPRFPGVPFDRGQPFPFRRCSDVRVSHTGKSPRRRFFLKTPGGHLFEFGEEEYFLWEALSGTKTIAEIDGMFGRRFGFRISPQQLTSFAGDLVGMQLAERAHAARAEAGEIAGIRRVQLYPTQAQVPAEAFPAEAFPASKLRPEALNSDRAQVRGHEPWTFTLGNPNALFGALAAVLWPVRFLTLALIPMTFVSVLVVIHHWVEYWSGLVYLWANIPWWPCAYACEHTMNFVSRAVQGIIIRGYGGAVNSFRVKLFMGWLVRAHIDETELKGLPRKAQLWVHASTLLLRLALFDFGCLFWVNNLNSHPTIARVALTIANIGLMTFAFCSFPLLPQDGYRWLATYLEYPNLRSRAFQYFGMLIKGRRPAEAMSAADRGALLFFALGTLICTGIWAGGISLQLFVAAVRNYRGGGMALVLSIGVAATAYFFLLWKYVSHVRNLRRIRLSQGAMR
jgi:hypothetical protein